MKKQFGALLMASAIAWSAAAGAALAAEGDGASVQVSMRVGSPEVIVNGERLEVRPPVSLNGTTLVPLRVITSAFDAELVWLAETQGIVLKYGDKVVEMNIDSLASTVNGEARTIPGAPKLIDGLTMVPVRFISETFGADVQYDPVTQAIEIKGAAAAGAAGPNGLSEDAGKTKFGDSHWGWTMDYPTGLVQDYQSFNGDRVIYDDVNGEYVLEIVVNSELGDVKESSLVNKLAEYSYGGTTLDKRLIRENGQVYAKIVSKTTAGTYTDERLYLKNGVAFFVTLEILSAENYKNPSKSAVYNALIDSFELTFDGKDAAVKDIATVKNGTVHYEDETYGISLQLPDDWTMQAESNGLTFYSYDSTYMLEFGLSSLDEGDTLEKWVQRNEDRLRQEFKSEYLEVFQKPDRKVGGADAAVRLWSRSFGTYAEDLYDVFVIKGEYKYNFTVVYDSKKRDAAAAVIRRIVDSIRIDEKVASAEFGYLDDAFSADLEETETYRNREYGFTMTVPEYWYEGEDHNAETMHFEFRGASIQADVLENTTSAEYKQFMDYYMEDLKKKDATMTILKNAATTFNGRPAHEIEFTVKDEIGTMHYVSTHFQMGDDVFLFSYTIYESNMTDGNMKRIADALASLTVE